MVSHLDRQVLDYLVLLLSAIAPLLALVALLFPSAFPKMAAAVAERRRRRGAPNMEAGPNTAAAPPPPPGAPQLPARSKETPPLPSSPLLSPSLPSSPLLLSPPLPSYLPLASPGRAVPHPWLSRNFRKRNRSG